MKPQHPAHPYSVYRRRRTQAEIWEAGLLRQGRSFVRMMCTSGAIVPPWLFEVLQRVGKRLGVWPRRDKSVDPAAPLYDPTIERR